MPTSRPVLSSGELFGAGAKDCIGTWQAGEVSRFDVMLFDQHGNALAANVLDDLAARFKLRFYTPVSTDVRNVWNLSSLVFEPTGLLVRCFHFTCDSPPQRFGR